MHYAGWTKWTLVSEAKLAFMRLMLKKKPWKKENGTVRDNSAELSCHTIFLRNTTTSMLYNIWLQRNSVFLWQSFTKITIANCKSLQNFFASYLIYLLQGYIWIRPMLCSYIQSNSFTYVSYVYSNWIIFTN